MRELIIVVILTMIVWGFNVFKFVSCDFESPYKCEVVHGVGVFIPPASLVTMWWDDDDA